MSKVTTIGYYTISYRIRHEHMKKNWWMRIGSATLRDDGSILARIEAIPVNWNGEFGLFPSEQKDEDAP